jgi:hypothetical protein
MLSGHTGTVESTRNEDKLAIEVHLRADATGRPITLGLVERHLDELRNHQPDCGCGLCAPAHAARGSGVFYVVQRWASWDRGDETKGGALMDGSSDRLPAERRFTAVWMGCCVAAGAFLLAFISITLINAIYRTQRLTASYYEAWGTWAGGLATAAAFLIAAFSIAVASAQARADRQEAARIRENNDMAQARLLVIYKGRSPGRFSR